MIIKPTTDSTTVIGEKRVVKAIIHVIKDGWVVDAESDAIALIPSTTPTVENPSPLYDTMVSAYGKRAQYTGALIKGETYSGHSVLSSTPSARTWKEMRKLEYRIEESKIEESLEQLKRLN